MGTNFYTVEEREDNMSPEYHVGKRSAAGLYCWDCRITLCSVGENFVHHCNLYDGVNAPETPWLKRCPKCGKAPEKESLNDSSVGRELGFNKSKPNKKTGVKSCSSFTWAIKPEEVEKCKYIWDEYGRKHTLKEFKQILKECPIQYFHIGEEFS